MSDMASMSFMKMTGKLLEMFSLDLLILKKTGHLLIPRGGRPGYPYMFEIYTCD